MTGPTLNGVVIFGNDYLIGFDQDNNISTYSWTKIQGSAAGNISNPNSITTLVKGLTKGTYFFELKVTDSAGLFSKDTILITVIDFACDVSMRQFTNAKLIPLGSLSQRRESIAIGSAGSKILFAGGSTPGNIFSTVDIYDIVSQTWSVASLSVPRYDIAVASAGNKIFFAGGYNGDDLNPITYNTVDIYDAVANTWTVTNMNTKAGGRAAAVLNNKVFFAGGYQTTGFASPVNLPSVVDIYDIQNKTWSVAGLSAGRSGIAAATANNKIYFAGGLDAGNMGVSTIDVYDDNTGKWTQNNLAQPAGNMASIVIGDNIYWAGGHTESPSRSLNRIEIINTKTNSVSADCLFQRNEVFTAVAAKNNRVVFFTGNSSLTGAKNKFDIYDITANSWSIGLLFDGIQGASIISVNNTIYVAGGYVLGNLTNQLWKLEF